MSSCFATLTFDRKFNCTVETLWQAWTAPTARALWASPSADIDVEFLEADTSTGGREISICKEKGKPDIRCEVEWLHLQPSRKSVNSEVISANGERLSCALITADLSAEGQGSLLTVTVQLSSLAEDMEQGYRDGFSAGLDNLVAVAERTMVLGRTINAPRDIVWGAWMNPETLPQWWGPEGFSCKTQRIDLRPGGEWVFDMIAPDGTVFPNHHLYQDVVPQERLSYQLLWGENGPKHADAWATFDSTGGATQVTLCMVFSSAAEFQEAKGFGAVELGLQTLGKLAGFIGAD